MLLPNKIFSLLADAIMEEMNKRVKFWLPKIGNPMNETWEKTIRLLQNIEKVSNTK